MLWVSLGFFPNPASASQAVDFKAKGVYQFHGSIGDSSLKDHDGADKFQAQQRIRTQIDMIASENLKGVLFFEIGHITWGKGGDGTGSSTAIGNNAGGSLGTDGVNVKTRYAYVDWVIPQTEVQVRMGLQNFTLPTFAVPNTVMGGGAADGAGLTISGQFTENVGATLFWLRAYDGEGANLSDNMDFVGLTVPVTFDGVKVTPWGMYGIIGNDSFEDFTGTDPTTYSGQYKALSNLLPVGSMGSVSTSSDDHGNAWWVGFASELTMFDPFRVALDAAYGSVDMGTAANGWDLKRAGWYAAALAEYKLDFMTPGIQFWYASGDDANGKDGSEMLPTVRADVNVSSYGYDGAFYNTYNSQLGQTVAGTWGVYAYLKDISFIEDLSHVLRVGYVQGTNNTNMVRDLGIWSVNDPTQNNQLYLTTADHAWEVNFDSTYNIYENLTLCVELGYINLDLDEGTWGRKLVDSYRDNNFRAGIEMQYSF